MGQPLPGSAEGPLHGGFLVARLCPRPAPFPALVGRCEPRPGDHRESRRGSHVARLYSFPDQSTAAPRRQHQPPRGDRRTRCAARVPARRDVLHPRLSVWLLAADAARHGTTASGVEPLTREDAQARRSAVIGRRGGALLGQLPHLAGSGHRRPDAVRRTAFLRSAHARSRRSAAVGIATAGARQARAVAQQIRRIPPSQS